MWFLGDDDGERQRIASYLGFHVLGFQLMTVQSQARAETMRSHCATSKPSLIWTRLFGTGTYRGKRQDQRQAWLLNQLLTQPLQDGRYVILEGEATLLTWDLPGIKALQRYPLVSNVLQRWCQWKVMMEDGLPSGRITRMLTNLALPGGMCANVAVFTHDAVPVKIGSTATDTTWHAASC